MDCIIFTGNVVMVIVFDIYYLLFWLTAFFPTLHFILICILTISEW